MTVFFAASVFISIAYLFVILLPAFGNFFRCRSIEKKSKTVLGISFIVPFRNEEHTLPMLLQSLPSACEGVEFVEVIFADDHSDDKSIEVIQQHLPLLHKSGIDVRILSENNYMGKKQTQRAAAVLAKHDVLAFTDADCVLPPGWTSNMLGHLKEGVDLLCAPVVYKRKSGLFAYLFGMEFLSLVITGAGAFALRKPVFCNGAAMMVRKNTYLNTHDAMQGKGFASGDDVFLLHAVVKQHGSASANFVFSREATVQTMAPESIKQFVVQRMRWASKAVSYRNISSVLMSTTVFLMSFMILVFAVIALSNPQALLPLLTMVAAKCFADFMMFLSGYGLHKSVFMPFLSIIVQPMYIVYVVTTSFMSMLLPVSWKGRATRSK
jgi:cellulose synthase/poly-beta-1,6-N-acetylglucosamine synthase-like glycosyltransferase